MGTRGLFAHSADNRLAISLGTKLPDLSHLLIPMNRGWKFCWRCLLTLIIAMASPGHAQMMFHNDQSERLGCALKTQGQTFFLSSFYFPEKQGRQNIAKKPGCNTFSNPGWVLFTIDLADKSLKSTPLGVKVVRQDAAMGQTAETVYAAEPQIYLQGVISHETPLNQWGHYNILISDHSNLNAAVIYALPLVVIKEEIAIGLWILAGVLLLAGGFFSVQIRSKNKQKNA